MSGRIALTVCLVVVMVASAGACLFADEPGWSPVIIARGEYRERIESTPIERRPYRPFHFYGNTVRRNHYRGNPLPRPKDLTTTAAQLVAPRP